MDRKSFDIMKYSKYFWLTVILFLLFVLLVSNAYRYIPQENPDKANVLQVDILYDNTDEEESEEISDADEDENEELVDSDENVIIDNVNEENLPEDKKFIKIWD